MNNSHDIDELIRSYFRGQGEVFTFEEKPKKNLRLPVLFATLLIFAGIIALCVPRKSSPAETGPPQHTENSVNIITATAVIERSLTAAPHTSTPAPTENKPNGPPSSVPEGRVAIFVIDGENLYGLKSRSLCQDATFFRVRNSDLKQNWRLKWDAYIDLNGQKHDSSYIYADTDTFVNVDEDGYYTWYLTEEARNRIAFAYYPESRHSDVVETIIYFNDGSCVVRHYNIAYSGDEMIIYENNETIYGWDSTSENASN